jgi:type II secretory pathway component PulF
MVARGFNGEMPMFERPTVEISQWLTVWIVLVTFAVIAATAIVLT